MPTTRYADFGSVSSGTIRTEDLLTALSDELDYQIGRQSRRYPRAAHRKLIHEAHKNLRALKRGAPDAGETAGYTVEDLFDALGEFAPPYAYFGAHPDDGADYGYWLSEDALYDFDGLRVDDLSEIPRGYRGEVLHSNDHGNITLYVAGTRGKMREVWALV